MPALSKKSKAATARRAAQQLAVIIGDEEISDEYFDEDIWEVVHEDDEPDGSDDDLEHDVMNGVGLDIKAAERLQVMETRWIYFSMLVIVSNFFVTNNHCKLLCCSASSRGF